MTPLTYDEWFHQNIKKQIGENVQYTWNATEVDYIISHCTQDQVIEQCISFCEKMDFPMLRKGNVVKLVEFWDIENSDEFIVHVFHSSRDELVKALGANGEKVYDGILNKAFNLSPSDLFGSYPGFGRGIGRRKMKKLFEHFTVDDMFNNIGIEQIANVDGFDLKTAHKILDGIEAFRVVFYRIETTVVLKQDTNEQSMAELNVCFTGFRDKELQERVEQMGGKVGSSVSKNTTIVVCKDVNGSSSKLKKARELGIDIVALETFKALYCE